MSFYTFDTLSPYDLEILTRDLLQAELGIRLESFAPGHDHGIDIRYCVGQALELVVQCKHYPRSTWAQLRRSLQADLPKVQVLAPRRYMVVTSLPLTPNRKAWVLKTFAPYCQSGSDVFGADDLNNLLGRHPAIERQHYKLWLTSTEVLNRVLHSDVFADQWSEIEHIKRKVARFVQNASVARAINILDNHQFCVITGLPGIGKTTLAEMLVIDFLNRGFECFRIWDDIGDARRVFRPNANQLFYYDDFLGRTGLRQPEKNEDERLLRLIRDVVSSGRHRLLLTSRDYILNQAQSVFEGFTRADLDPARCVVNLEDYTRRIRAEILYNHLYHSGVPQEHIGELLKSRTYRTIVRHRNYSPRIVEAMTDVVNVRDLAPSEYPATFVANLENPARLWQVAYGSHLTHAAQNTLLVIASLEDEVLMSDAERAFDAFHRARSQRYAQPSTPYDWKRALRELEGTFLAIGPNHGAITIQFHNPSVRDFVESLLRETPSDVAELIDAAVFPDQLARIFNVLEGTPNRTWISPALRRFLQIFDKPSGKAYVVRYTNGTLWQTRVESPIVRYITFTRIAALAPSKEVTELLETATDHVLRYLRTQVPNCAEVTRLLEAILEGSIPLVSDSHELFLEAHGRAYAEFDALPISLDEYDALAEFAQKHPAQVSDEALQVLRTDFSQVAIRELEELDGYDPDTALLVYDQLADIANHLNLSLSMERHEIEERIGNWPEEDYDDTGFRPSHREADQISDDELDAMFDSLRR